MPSRLTGSAVLAIVLVFALTGGASAEYTLRTSGTAEGGGFSAAGSHSLAFTLGQASPVGISANSSYDLASGLVMMLLDVSPPLILHEDVPGAGARVALDIRATVSDDRTGVESVTIFYREGGISTFRQKTMADGGDGLYTGTLSPSAVTEKGLVYYIEARDKAQNVSRHPAGAPDTLIGVPVEFEDLISFVEMQGGEYRMISLPGNPDGGIDDILVDDLGNHSRTSWRLGRWKGGAGCEADCYDEYPNVDAFAPGRGFWLISKSKTRFDFSGTSVDIRQPHAVPLYMGWNQIATPFAFTTDWISTRIRFDGQTYALNEEYVVGTDTVYVEDNLVAYDGIYQGHQSSMEPWHGYWVYNGSTQPVEALIYPDIQSALLAGGSGAGGPYAGRKLESLITVSVSSGETLKGTILAGTSPEAGDSWDELDHREPPAIGDHVRLIFDRPDWGRRAGKYMSDIRKTTDGGCAWSLTAESSVETAASIIAEPAIDLPSGWDLFLYDLESGLKLAGADMPYPFRMDGKRGFMLVAGTPDFVRAEEGASGIDLRPQIVSTAPNPFAGDIRISLFIPSSQRVKLGVYTVEGRRVGMVADERLDTGVHIFTWSGRSQAGEPVSPGIYFLRFETDGSLQTRKILKVN
jgi:hypothetical protein